MPLGDRHVPEQYSLGRDLFHVRNWWHRRILQGIALLDINDFGTALRKDLQHSENWSCDIRNVERKMVRAYRQDVASPMKKAGRKAEF